MSQILELDDSNLGKMIDILGFTAAEGTAIRKSVAAIKRRKNEAYGKVDIEKVAKEEKNDQKFFVGDSIVLKGLVKAGKYNGHIATVYKPYNPDTGRYGIILLDE